ncbi:methyl-accepting chemotaxis protein [Duganella sp. BJB488]|uniref:methyl-accepting chemotaxis protein n=1 Tax=unclassified Duganella TaxID=2636909 RepID=UPI000E350D9C|nr:MULTISPECIES: methyl-accepting chemotaxis protein [unclassified Duganella]RFP13139.1 methyl-accepting chemotaxis protein [Duganella sp. BJB489]RFP17098.1 methyl-accepting chemotaxis protein [Duganella sp. BJB488]RFP31683.1 methyl-accepting chemotaxis protein [Duganella sp. BJB480]
MSPRDWGVGTKITVITFGLIAVILVMLLSLINMNTSTMLTERAKANVANTLGGISNTVDVFNTAMTNEASSFARLFAAGFGDGKFTRDSTTIVDIGGKATPSLKHDGKTLNLDFAIPDKFTADTGVVATIFAASGDEFVRVSTSLKKENGERAVGTQLDHGHPSYAPLRAGDNYIGLATLFGKQYITQYDPIKDAGGQVIGVLFIGLDISKNMAMLKEKIKAIKIGDSGYIYVVNAAPGKALGTALVHPAKEGESLIDNASSDGRPFVKDMLEAKEGSMRYSWADSAGAAPREKMVEFHTFKPWNWLIVGGTYTEEITREAGQLRNRYAALGLVSLALFAAILFLLVRANITRPLARAEAAATRIAQGNLDVQLAIDNKDEIGLLLYALNGICKNLSGVVGQVRLGAEQITTASNEIAASNLDLSSRTEEQASNLEETATSMERLSSAVKQNADNAAQANQMALAASGIAAKGGEVVAQVVDTMDSINQSSRKIVDIISVIDSIAFQTNILALNAAVEAARAGEQGRGFAVVASEVRNLAQRSATAAKEIKALIDDSVNKVDIGSAQVAKAGSTMQEVVVSVRRVTDIMAEISTASDEQRAGIGQVHEAIAQMNQVTQQNAALVEQAAAAAHALQDQASDLEQVVRIFKLGDGYDSAPPCRAGWR